MSCRLLKSMENIRLVQKLQLFIKLKKKSNFQSSMHSYLNM